MSRKLKLTNFFPYWFDILDKTDTEKNNKTERNKPESVATLELPIVSLSVEPVIQEVIVIKTEPQDCSEMSEPMALSRKITNDWDSIELFKTGNLGYKKLGEDILYICLIQNCGVSLEERILFQEHIFANHTGFLWEGYCYQCEAQIVSDDTYLAKEMEHMERVHLKIHDSIIPCSLQPVENNDYQPKIKMRRIGDLINLSENALDTNQKQQ